MLLLPYILIINESTAENTFQDIFIPFGNLRMNYKINLYN